MNMNGLRPGVHPTSLLRKGLGLIGTGMRSTGRVSTVGIYENYEGRSLPTVHNHKMFSFTAAKASERDASQSTRTKHRDAQTPGEQAKCNMRGHASPRPSCASCVTGPSSAITFKDVRG